MATKSQSDHLVKVGREAFDILDECLGRKRRPPPPPNAILQHKPVQFGAAPRKEPIDSTQVAANELGGVLFVTHRRRVFY
ncbi:hypothetical protein COCNU_04G010350 [Cocos nucifera]|uniref:Uncharacterized protein n=1 Tax=Cocos nucifera TaxID=13894 RepID=A0A8K0I7C3_COCNU|nr:hypothetical protein COCNU_04G010350 [Cocos nucifera]